MGVGHAPSNGPHRPERQRGLDELHEDAPTIDLHPFPGAWRRAVAMRRPIALVTVSVMTLFGFVAATGPAQAKVSGRNGQIVFARYDPSIDDSHVFTVNPNGTHEDQLLDTAAEIPHWSPDGT